MIKPGFNYGFNVRTNFCIKTTQCENTTRLAISKNAIIISDIMLIQITT